MSATAEAIRRKSLELGGGGEVNLAYAPGLASANDGEKPWQASTTVKPRYWANRRLWVWGRSPDDALWLLLRAMGSPS